MNDDLLLLITYISVDKQLVKVALKIEHGLNIEDFKSLKYFAESESLKTFKSILPEHVAMHMDYIVDLDRLFEICEYK